jgi:hypothetical protein
MGSSFFDKTWKEFVSLGTHFILIRFYVQFLIIRSIRCGRFHNDRFHICVTDIPFHLKKT